MQEEDEYTKIYRELEEITGWLKEKGNIDPGEALTKVRRGAELNKKLKEFSTELANEFHKIEEDAKK